MCGRDEIAGGGVRVLLGGQQGSPILSGEVSYAKYPIPNRPNKSVYF